MDPKELRTDASYRRVEKNTNVPESAPDGSAHQFQINQGHNLGLAFHVSKVSKPAAKLAKG